ncbi:MAG: peptidoglycan editing factor PgeF [Rubrobacteridae bacterium]|nr:peptidoglycan editing factor PgeF [Rubrobacteridae bacterium]
MHELCKVVLENNQDIKYFVAKELLEKHGILVAFTGRSGGVSEKPFDSLNLGLHVGDNPENVRKNREIIAKALRIDETHLTCAEQVHGNAIAIIDGRNAGRGAFSFSDAISGVDALITSEANIPLGLFFADCVPVVLVDTETRTVAVVHAGWRGVYNHIVERAALVMTEQKKANSSTMIAYIGPSIGGCCFEVGADLIERFNERFENPSVWLKGKNKIDLPQLIAGQLNACGIDESRIGGIEICTSCNNDILFSYRADNENTGRQSAIACICLP